MNDPIIAWGLGVTPPAAEKRKQKPKKQLSPVDQRIRERRYKDREFLGASGMLKLTTLAQRLYEPGQAFSPASEEFMQAVWATIRPGIEPGAVAYTLRRHAQRAHDPALIYDHSTKLFMLNPDWPVFSYNRK